MKKLILAMAALSCVTVPTVFGQIATVKGCKVLVTPTKVVARSHLLGNNVAVVGSPRLYKTSFTTQPVVYKPAFVTQRVAYKPVMTQQVTYSRPIVATTSLAYVQPVVAREVRAPVRYVQQPMLASYSTANLGHSIGHGTLIVKRSPGGFLTSKDLVVASFKPQMVRSGFLGLGSRYVGGTQLHLNNKAELASDDINLNGSLSLREAKLGGVRFISFKNGVGQVLTPQQVGYKNINLMSNTLNTKFHSYPIVQTGFESRFGYSGRYW